MAEDPTIDRTEAHGVRTPLDRTDAQLATARVRLATWLVALLAVAVGLAGCSGDDDGGGGEREPDSPTTASRAPAVQSDAELGKVRGTLTRARKRNVLADVTTVVEGWFAGGFAGDYPRRGFKAAFADFTKDAAALARKQPRVMSNAALGARLDGVRVLKQTVRVDVAAPRGRLAGATARFRLRIALSGAVERTDVVSGRLLLTPTERGWRVFGFDVRRSEGAA